MTTSKQYETLANAYHQAEDMAIKSAYGHLERSRALLSIGERQSALAAHLMAEGCRVLAQSMSAAEAEARRLADVTDVVH